MKKIFEEIHWKLREILITNTQIGKPFSNEDILGDLRENTPKKNFWDYPVLLITDVMYHMLFWYFY